MYRSFPALDNAPVAVVCSSLEDLMVFVHGTDSTLKYLKLKSLRLMRGVQTTKNWQSDGKWFGDTPVVFSTRKFQLKIFGPTPYGKVLYQDTQGDLLVKEYWESIGDIITSPLTGVSWAPHRFDIFGLSTKGQVLQKTLEHGNWLPSKDTWTELGGAFSLPPAAVSTVPGHLHVFCVGGYKGPIYHKWWNGSTWMPGANSWAVNNTFSMSPPTVVATDRTRIEIFIRNTKNDLLHGIYEEGDWFEYIKWNSLSSPDDNIWISRPAAVLTRLGHIEIFCLASDNELYHRSCVAHTRAWSEWESLGGDFDSAPTAIASRDGKVHVFCRGYDEQIHYMNLREKVWISLGLPD